MSLLSRLARAAADYMTRRTLSELAQSRHHTIPQGMGDLAARSRGRNRTPGPPGGMESTPGAPPIQGGGREEPANIPPTPPTDDDDQERFDDITIFGRDASNDQQEWQELNTRLRVVASSNVYGYAFQAESPTMGILYVQYLNWTPRQFGGDGSRSGPGSLYAYYDVPIAKYREFESHAASSAGGAVWDYLRVRGSMFEHQHTYRLVSTSGPYVPRKATAKGFKARNTAGIGTGMRRQKGERARQQLAPRSMAMRRVLPSREPFRGLPNRGEPNRGR